MGFKYKKFTVTVGSSEYPTTTDAAGIRAKEEWLTSHFAQAIIDCNCGWSLDTNRNATTSNFFAVKKYTSSADAPGLFLQNVSGCKLFISYLHDTKNGGIAFLDTDDTTKIFKDDFVCTVYNPDYQNAHTSIQGLIMSMIPEDSSSAFGSTCNINFLPSDATRLYGSATNCVGSYSNDTYANLYTSNEKCVFQVFATPYCIGVGFGFNDWSTPHYFCGRILDELADISDSLDQAKYGTLAFRRSGSDSYSYISDRYLWHNCSWVDVMNNSGSTSSVPILGIAPHQYHTYNCMWRDGSAWGPWLGNCISKANGEWVSNTEQCGISPLVNPMLLSTALYDSSSNKRPWQPIAMVVCSKDLNIDGITPGMALKGYLDTNLFRCSPQYSAGTTFANGNFICTDACCLTLGWDPTNDDW